MENKFVQPLLQAGLLEIGDNDERLEHIEKSIADLEEKLKDEQSLLPSYTLAALDPHIDSGEPVLVAVEAIVSNHWKSLRSKFTERPVHVLRAVIIQAIYNVGSADERNARIIFLTAANFYPYAKLGREKTLTMKMLSELGEKAEEHAKTEWSLNEQVPTLKISPLKIEPLKISPQKLDQEGLKKKLYESTSYSNTRQYAQNSQDQWASIFSNGAAEGIVNIVTSAVKGMSDGFDLTAMTASINKVLSGYKTALDQSLKSSFESMRAVERRTQLLWWKETMYSSSLKDSYRNVNNTVQPVVMARDLCMQLPDIVPESVNFLLRDTLLQLNQAADNKLSFSEILLELSKSENKQLLNNCFDDTEVKEGRISITNYIGLLVNGRVEASSLKARAGIDATEQLSLADLAIMLLRDWMADNLIPKKN